MVAARTLQLLLMPGKITQNGGKTERICNQGALKAQLQSAQGSALGYCVYIIYSAPCKGNYIKIERLKNGNGIAISPKW